jgi:NAD(P)-dependent dehydrogenase (short-subunit alcohol dehydrogenase family)
MVWTEADIPDLSGRTAVVTGANGGLGLQTALALAGAGAHVVLAARDPSKTEAAEKRIRATHPSASLEVVPLDLGDLSVVSAAASTILAVHERVDLLVNNAGVMAMPQRTTVDGFEMQFGVDHLGHWAPTAHLLPALLRAPAARVVTVTSTARHRARRLDPSDVHLERGYGA